MLPQSHIKSSFCSREVLGAKSTYFSPQFSLSLSLLLYHLYSLIFLNAQGKPSSIVSPEYLINNVIVMEILPMRVTNIDISKDPVVKGYRCKSQKRL